jgi:hypothetical protein
LTSKKENRLAARLASSFAAIAIFFRQAFFLLLPFTPSARRPKPIAHLAFSFISSSDFYFTAASYFGRSLFSLPTFSNSDAFYICRLIHVFPHCMPLFRQYSTRRFVFLCQLSFPFPLISPPVIFHIPTFLCRSCRCGLPTAFSFGAHFIALPLSLSFAAQLVTLSSSVSLTAPPFRFCSLLLHSSSHYLFYLLLAY